MDTEEKDEALMLYLLETFREVGERIAEEAPISHVSTVIQRLSFEKDASQMQVLGFTVVHISLSPFSICA
jgi:hypothetical protein